MMIQSQVRSDAESIAEAAFLELGTQGWDPAWKGILSERLFDG